MVFRRTIGHAAYAVGKGTKCANQIKRLSKNSKGMQGAFARRMFYGVTAASMLYAADVWCAPPRGRRGRNGRIKEGTTAAIRKMETVQRKAALQVTGALRTTPTDLLFAHADMIPMQELL
ncbi:hypothetical protein BDZ97DRAFT_1676236, partial [Flammula alnicola]